MSHAHHTSISPRTSSRDVTALAIAGCQPTEADLESDRDSIARLSQALQTTRDTH